MRTYRSFCLLLLLLCACQSGVRTTSPALAPTVAPTIQPTSQEAGPSPTAIRIPAAGREPMIVSPVGMDGALVVGTGGMPWWNDTVFYEVFVRSFYDSNGDGIGDLNGLMEKLDYLNDGDPNTHSDLGITGIWLMPITQSPSYHGYDVVDYYKVDDEYGNNEDFLRLMEEAHKRGIRVIVDLVLNHTSIQHPWFQEALDPNSKRRDWYVWSDKPQLGIGWHASISGYYYGYFWEGMPDLNYRNPAVTEAMQDVARFWLQDMGVDGFRLDAVKHLIEDGPIIENALATYTWLQDFFTFYKSIKPDAVTVGEVWDTTDIVATYVGSHVDLAFEFDLAEAMLTSALTGRRVHVEKAQQAVTSSYPPGQFATFLANHDQIRTRSRLFNDEQAKVAATLQLTFCGVPFIYYGEEIGMQGKKPDENIRRPMQWTPDGGFTTGQPWRPFFDDYQQRHVAGQSEDPNSLLNHYRTLIRLRNMHAALRVGQFLPLETGHQSLYACLRFNDQEIVLVLVNLDSKPITEYGLTLPAGPLCFGLQPVLLMGEGKLYAPQVNEAGGFVAYQPVDTLPPYSSFIIQFVP